MRTATLMLCLVMGLLVELLPHGASAVELKPTRPTFTLVEPSRYHLGDRLILELRTDNKLTIDAKKITLSLDGEPAGLFPRMEGSRLIFQLERIEDQSGAQKGNRALWERLFAEPYQQERVVPITLHNGDDAIDYAGTAEGGPATATITLVKYSRWAMAFGLLFIIAVVVGVWWFGRYSGMLRDAPVPQMPPTERSFSLGRCQMAVWFCLIITSFVLITVTLQDLNSINTQSFILLGISAATGIAAVAIDNGRNDITVARDALIALGLAAAKDVVDLRMAVQNGVAGAQQRLDTYNQITAAYRSEGLLRDLVTDAGGVTLHRFQIVIWTLILAVIYIIQVYTSLKPPTFGDNLLILMGITNGIYVGFKPAEKRT